MQGFSPCAGTREAEEARTEVRAVRAIEDEMSRRSIRSTTLDPIDYRPSSAIPASQLAPTGTIAVYVSRRGSPLLKEIRDAARNAKSGRDRTLARRIIRTARQRKPVPLTDAARRMLTQPVLAHLSYAGTTMAQHLFAESEQDLYVTVLPYAGGPLVERGFRFDEYLHEDDDEPLECVLLKNPPVLNAAELAALKKVPPEMAHAYVSPLDIRAATPLAAAALYVVVWGFVAATYTWAKANWDESGDHINPEALNSMGPTAAVRAMLRLRIDILKGTQNAVEDVAAQF